jgi:hypothetical protein
MPDDRPALLPEEAIAALRRDVDDLKSTLSYRTSRRPTGTMEPTFLTTVPPDTLLLNGASVNRITYAGLWKWVTTNSLNGTIGVQPFGNGDLVTTFQLPDLRGRVLIGNDGLAPVGADVGANTKLITIANLPPHGHEIGGGTDDAGSHGGHGNSTSADLGAGGYSVVLGTDSRGNHWHGANALWAELEGDGVAFDVRQLGKVVNWVIWT